MKHTSPSVTKWCILLSNTLMLKFNFPLKIFSMHMRKATLQKTVVYFTAVVTECSVIIEMLFFFPPPSVFFFFSISSSFFLLCPGSLHKLSALMVYSFYSTFGLLSVHVVCLYASQLFSARDLPHGFICYGECFLPYQWTTSPGKRSIFFSTSVNFFFFFLNRKLNQKKIDCPSLPITLQNTAILQIIAEFKLQNDWYSLFIWLCMFILWMGKGDWVLWFNCDFLQHVSWQAEQHCYISNFWIKTCKAVSCLW